MSLHKDISAIREVEYNNVIKRMKNPKSKEAENLGRRILKEKGYYVFPKFVESYTPTADNEDIEDHSDSGDILFVYKKSIEIAEAKRHNNVTYWNSKENYPYKMVFVDGKYQFDNKIIKPILYMIFNKDLTCMATVNVLSTKEYWDTYKCGSVNKYDKWFYRCPIDKIKFKVFVIDK